KVAGIKKAGHTGTLDPLATGVLPVCIGEATKLVPFLVSVTKDYRVSMLLGVRTDTLDVEGAVLEEKEPQVTEQGVNDALQGFLGRSEQIPPRYSAIKVRGRALYKWARQGVVVEPPPRMVEIYQLTVEEISLPYVTFRMSCSGGTYVRSLCADVGDLLGCGACVAGLRRTRSGIFSEAAAIVLDRKDRHEDGERVRAGLIPLAELLPDLRTIVPEDSWVKRIKDGVHPRAEMVNRRDDIPFLDSGDMVKLTGSNGELVAIAELLCGSGELAGLQNDVPVMRLLRVFKEN
ncbi:MAG: tRNA pseudouridine(55) synthase TruB, partial [Syntrophales bacterium]